MSVDQYIWDVFIAHASEDKETVARPLANELAARGLRVWLDEAEIRLGDSLRGKIDEGLAKSRFGVVILSPHFFSKQWTRSELGGLISREVDGQTVILPVWHNMTPSSIKNHSPILADRLAIDTHEGLPSVATKIEAVVNSSGLRYRPGPPNFKGFQIQFRESQTCFRAAKRPTDKEWIDTSFARSPRAVGRLRLPAVDNGRYESKHPILDEHGATVGFMVGGVGSLGYTFTCVYAGNCFWITHQGFSAVIYGTDVSGVSLVDATRMFMFSAKGAKFKVVKSFGFGGNWPDNIRAFKLLDDGAYLLYLTNYGVCLFDTRTREIVAKAEFTGLAYQWSGFALSPKAKLLAIGCSERGDEDPLDGAYHYNNFIRIYNLISGIVVGEKALQDDQQTQWAVDFSEDGRQLRVASNSSTRIFELAAVR